MLNVNFLHNIYIIIIQLVCIEVSFNDFTQLYKPMVNFSRLYQLEDFDIP